METVIRQCDKRRSTFKTSLNNFKDIFNKKFDIRDIINTGLEGKQNEDLRSFIWKLFLNILPYDCPENWVKIVSKSREAYYCKLDLFINETLASYINDEVNNIEELNFEKEDIEMMNLIKLDIRRTYQEIDLFRNNHVKESLVKILYIWSKENPETSYCQGMNEILGTLCYAIYPTKFTGNLIANDEATSTFYFINSEEGFEADLYTLFTNIMSRSLKELYNYNDAKGKGSKGNIFNIHDFHPNIRLKDIKESHCSTLAKRINTIFYYYLNVVDPELYTHIYDKVEPYLFMFRWILCMLTREITSLKNVIYVWDCIFAFEHVNNTSIGLEFLDSMCLSMILSVKKELMEEDDGCFMLQTLMHFPNELSIKEVVKQAMIIRELINDHIKMLNELEKE
jgi:TBC1 domain family protein 5